MKKGFTLAEVLITLAVIGVVAALTIPVLVQKYQKKQLFTQFMKTYNTVTTALDNAVAEYGDIDTWNWGKWEYNDETGEDEFISSGDNPVEAYIFSQLKYVKKCDVAKECFASDYNTLSGSTFAQSLDLPKYISNRFATSVKPNLVAIFTSSVKAEM